VLAPAAGGPHRTIAVAEIVVSVIVVAEIVVAEIVQDRVFRGPSAHWETSLEVLQRSGSIGGRAARPLDASAGKRNLLSIDMAIY
jgi:hypothetical protein